MPAVQNTLIELQSIALLKLRAAGKLPQPQALLINNEREILGSVSQLRDYVHEGRQQAAALQQRYTTLLTSINLIIPELAHSRQSYFSTAAANKSDINQHLQKLTLITQQLTALPRFNLYEENDDNDSLGALLGNSITKTDTPRNERGDLYIQELNNLIKRYNKELLNIEQIYAHRTQSIEATSSLINQLNSYLQENQNRLQEHYDNTSQSVL